MFQFSSVTQSCPTLCDPMDCSMPGLLIHRQLPELTQTHVHWVSDAIFQLSHPLLSPSLPTFNLSLHQGIFKWVNSLHHLAKVLGFQLQHQFTSICKSFTNVSHSVRKPISKISDPTLSQKGSKRYSFKSLIWAHCVTRSGLKVLPFRNKPPSPQLPQAQCRRSITSLRITRMTHFFWFSVYLISSCLFMGRKGSIHVLRTNI